MRRTQEQWQNLIEEQQQSGLTAAKFCADKNINPNYFSLRKSRLKPQPQKTSKNFVRLSPEMPEPSLQLTYRTSTLTIPASFPIDRLADLMRGLV